MITDLRAHLGNARDQGRRRTCLAFAISDAHRVIRKQRVNCSPEALHQLTTKRLGIPLVNAIAPKDGTQTLRNDGQPHESDWPYNSNAAHQAALFYKRASRIMQFDAALLQIELDAGSASVLGLKIGREFFNARRDTILEPQNILPPEAHHAVLVVASRKVANVSQFLLRNSWGTGWGGDGHVWACENYLSATSLVMICLEGELT